MLFIQNYYMELNNTQLIIDYCHFNKKWLVIFSEFFAMNDLICFGFFTRTIKEGITKIDNNLKNAKSREELIELSNQFEEWENDETFICDFDGKITNNFSTNHLHHYVTKNDDDLILIQSLIPDPKDKDDALKTSCTC